MRTARRLSGAVTLSLLLAGCAGASFSSTAPPTILPTASAPASASVAVEAPALPGGSAAGPAPPGWSDAIVVHGIAFADPTHGVMVGASAWQEAVGVVWRTADGGRTWAKTVSGTGPLDAVTIGGPGTMVSSTACGQKARADCALGVLVSDDGGASWTRISTEPATALSFPTATVGWAIVAAPAAADIGPSSVLLSTADGGRSWARHPNGCPATTGSPVAVSFPDPNHGWVACNATAGAGMATKAILATVDGGLSWTVMAASPVPGEGQEIGTIAANGYLSGLAMVSDGHGLLWMGRGVTERTADGGRTWVAMPPGEWDAREAQAGWALDDRHWMLYVWNGSDQGPAVEATLDGGHTWSILATVPAPAS